MKNSSTKRKRRNTRDIASEIQKQTTSVDRIRRWFYNAERSYHSDNSLQEALHDLVKVKWNVYFSSGFYNFKSDTQSLKRYAKKLKERLACEVTGREYMNQHYKATFSVIPELKKTENDPVAIKVDVKSCLNDAVKYSYTGIFLSWGAENEQTDGFVDLPILLCRGNTNLMVIVNETIQKFFDSVFYQLFIRPRDLMCIALFLTRLTEPLAADVQFSFITTLIATRHTVNIAVSQTEIMQLWDRICDENCSYVDEETIFQFYKLLRHTFEGILQMDFSLFQMSKIKCKYGVIDHNGKIEITNTDTMEKILTLLSSILLK